MYKELAQITIPADLSAIAPLQTYVRELAISSNVDSTKVLNLEYLVEELFVGIIRHALRKENEDKIELRVRREYDSFVLSFHYRGLPFGYNIDDPEDDQDFISMELIHGLSSSFRIHEDGKAGQMIEVKIGVSPVESFKTISYGNDRECVPATDDTVIRHIENEDMESLVQCLYYVFDYNYAMDDMYNPSALKKKKAEGLYDGLVAKNSSGKIVAHVAMLKKSRNDKICESAQAFVMPEYGKRGLFPQLKSQLIGYADQIGLYGVTSSSVTGHPYTQRANISLGCVETGIGIGYIPSDMESVIKRTGKGKRQSVMTYFRTTSHKPHLKVFLPKSHSDIIVETYAKLGLEREISICAQDTLPEGCSIISSNVNNIWNHVYMTVFFAGRKDFRQRVESLLRGAAAAGCAVCYVTLPLDSENTSAIIAELEKIGFFYSGTLPYEVNGCDAVKMQCLICNENISEEDVIAESEWGKRLRSYIFNEMNR